MLSVQSSLHWHRNNVFLRFRDRNYCCNSMESPLGHDLAALRAADIALLRHFGIKLICDLMVEDKKRVYVLLCCDDSI